MTRRQIMATVAAGAAGLAAAAALTLAPTANAYAPDQLPSLGYAVSVLALGNNCHSWSATGYGAHADLGSDCEPGFQAALDAFVTATCPCAQPPATTTAPATTEAVIAPVTTAATTTAASPSTTTAAPEQPAQAATAPATAPADVQAQIANLQAQIDALRGQFLKLLQILAVWPNPDPGILALLLSATP